MSKTSKTKAKQKLTAKRKVLLAFLAAALLLVCFLICMAFVHHIQTEKQFKQDKIRYAQTEKDMSDAYNAIVQSVGQPYETKLTKACAYGALKYARGSLGCMITRTIVFAVSTGLESKGQSEMILAILNGHYGFKAASPRFGISNLDQQSGQFTMYMNNTNGLGCSLTHDTYTKNEYNSFGKNLNEFQKDTSIAYVAAYNLRCDRNVEKPLYTVYKTTE